MDCPAHGAYFCRCLGGETVWTVPLSAAAEGMDNFYRGRLHRKNAFCFVYGRSGLIAAVEDGRCLLLDSRRVCVGLHFMGTLRCVELRIADPVEDSLARLVASICRTYPLRTGARTYVVRFNCPNGRGMGYNLSKLCLDHVFRLQRFARRIGKRRRDRLVAVMMAFHPRLGAGSALGTVLDVDLMVAHVVQTRC